MITVTNSEVYTSVFVLFDHYNTVTIFTPSYWESFDTIKKLKK